MRIVIGEGSCGLAAGAGAVHARLEKLLAQGNPAGATLGITGCIGMCFLEPIVDVYEDDGTLHRLVKVQAKDAQAIYDAAMKDLPDRSRANIEVLRRGRKAQVVLNYLEDTEKEVLE